MKLSTQSSTKPSLFVGVTSWNSELLLPVCLQALVKTTAHLSAEIVVLDNHSQDRTAEIVQQSGVQLIQKKCTQADALNHLFALSEADYTLLIHADVVMLAADWFERCCAQMLGQMVLLSPEDIGCGPMSRPFGKDMPESSFLFFDTALAQRLRLSITPQVTGKAESRWRSYCQRLGHLFGRQYPHGLDFYGPHVTHRLPEQVQTQGLNWQALQVLHSTILPQAQYTPQAPSDVWQALLGQLEYGLGNFYAIDGVVTHYHNWYDRIDFSALSSDPAATSAAEGKGFPLAFIKAYTERFLRDYRDGAINLPDINQPQREPKAL